MKSVCDILCGKPNPLVKLCRRNRKRLSQEEKSARRKAQIHRRRESLKMNGATKIATQESDGIGGSEAMRRRAILRRRLMRDIRLCNAAANLWLVDHGHRVSGGHGAVHRGQVRESAERKQRRAGGIYCKAREIIAAKNGNEFTTREIRDALRASGMDAKTRAVYEMIHYMKNHGEIDIVSRGFGRNNPPTYKSPYNIVTPLPLNTAPASKARAVFPHQKANTLKSTQPSFTPRALPHYDEGTKGQQRPNTAKQTSVGDEREAPRPVRPIGGQP